MHRHGYVFLLASGRNGTLYIGVTNDIARRVWEHREGKVEGFSKRFDVTKLVYYEEFEDVRDAIVREKVLKKWRRAWKLDLIEQVNPFWDDLYDRLLDSPGSPRARGWQRMGDGTIPMTWTRRLTASSWAAGSLA